jgi:uncharacterized membrane protein HdeD (DUF308 family)
MMMDDLSASIERVRRHTGWYVTLGVVLMVLGAVAIAYPLVATVVAVEIFGWLLILSGIAQMALAIQVRRWSGAFLHFLGGILEAVVGVLILRTPLDAAMVLTLLVAVALLVGGLFRLTAAIVLRFPGSGLVALGGIVSALLGFALVAQWPASGLWFIGTCMGIDMALHGASWVAFALGVRQLPEAPASDAAHPESGRGATP